MTNYSVENKKEEYHESEEDYLEAILMLQEKNGHVRAVDIAKELNFTKASVSVAMKKLREKQYISNENGSIVLLEPGRKIAEHVYERHKLFTNFFISLGIDETTARNDACRIEHDLSDETFEKVKAEIERFLTKNA